MDRKNSKMALVTLMFVSLKPRLLMLSEPAGYGAFHHRLVWDSQRASLTKKGLFLRPILAKLPQLLSEQIRLGAAGVCLLSAAAYNVARQSLLSAAAAVDVWAQAAHSNCQLVRSLRKERSPPLPPSPGSGRCLCSCMRATHVSWCHVTHVMSAMSQVSW